MSTPEVMLLVGGIELTEWQSYQIESDIVQPADAFSLLATNSGGKMAGKVAPGHPFVLMIDGSVQMKGKVDDVHYRTTRQGPSMEIVGRDLFGQLVDNSAEPKSYRSMTLLTLAEQIASQWVTSWTTTTGVSLATHRLVKVDPGESVMEVLLRLAKKDRVILWVKPDGTGVIGRPDYDQAPAHALRLYGPKHPLAATNNITEQDVTETWRDRYTKITVLGSSGSTASVYGKAALVRQTDEDDEVQGDRHLILVDGDIKSIAEAQARAKNEVERRAWESVVLRYVARGLYGGPATPGASSSLFQADQRATLVDELAAIDGTYYLSARRFRMDRKGTFTDLELHMQGWMQ